MHMGDEIGQRLLERGWAIGGGGGADGGFCRLRPGRRARRRPVVQGRDLDLRTAGHVLGPRGGTGPGAYRAMRSAGGRERDVTAGGRHRGLTTGVGGPGAEEGKPAGTVYVLIWQVGRATVDELHLEGGPAEVVSAATRHALAAVLAALQ